MGETNAKAVAIAYYESCGFELLREDYECVDGSMGLVFCHDDVLRFVDVYDNSMEMNEETECRVRAVVESYLRENGHAGPMEIGYDVVTAIEHPNGIRFDVDVDLVEFVNQENKRGFVEDFQKALIEHGAGRYDHLKERPIRYEVNRGVERLRFGNYCRNVTGDSLTSIARKMLVYEE